MTNGTTDSVKRELARLPTMTPAELRQRYAEVFREPSHSANKQYLVKKIAWRIQALAEPNFEERLKRLRECALQIANDADLRIIPPRNRTNNSTVKLPTSTTLALAKARTDPRLPSPGAVLTRQYRGQQLQVTVRTDGFEFDGQRFKSLSAVAKHVSGSHCNGYAFFRVGKDAVKKAGGGS